jgi:secondary thiamine-phosphate synthase enzyme
MIHYQSMIAIQTRGKEFANITGKVKAIAADSGIRTGLCTLFIRHTSASLIVQENADPDVLTDLATFLARLVPEDSSLYRHNAEGADDMPAHIRSVLTQTSEQIPIANGRLVLGTWQSIYVWEHRQRSHQREIFVHIIGEK